VETAGVYRGPLEDFVTRRNALVRELRGTDPDAASAIGKLRKPPAGVWAIDQLAVDNPALLATLLAAGADARDAQRDVAAGTVTREDLLDATGRLRNRVEAVARAATDILARARHGASEDTARRLRTTLQAAATGGAPERQALWAGTLDRDLDVTGFGAVEDSDDDAPELAAILAPLRRPISSGSRGLEPKRASASLDVVAQRAAERTIALQEAAAQRARDAAVAARRDADRLAEEARVAAEKALTAEHEADAVEGAAKAGRTGLDR
jgi:hypothetical protein